MPRSGVASGEAGGVQLDGMVDRDPTPVGHLGARAEPRRGEALDHTGHHIVGRAILVEVLLDPERQEGDLAREGTGQQIVGVQVSHRVEDPRQLGVEQPLRTHRLGGLAFQADPQQTQALHRVDRVHRRLERKVHIVLLQQHQGLLHEEPALLKGESARTTEKLAQLHRGGQLVTDRLGDLGKEWRREGGALGGDLGAAAAAVARPVTSSAPRTHLPSRCSSARSP
jgi:hypothetical protein